MLKKFTYEYWQDGELLVGRIRELEGVFSQGKTLEELEVNLKEAFHLIMQENNFPTSNLQIRELELEV
jgi:predicted RNase H-like HicB family nuclease